MKQYKDTIYLAKSFTNKPSLLIKDLILIYSHFKNKDKIIKLLIIWLAQNNFFYLTYSKSKNLKKFLITTNSILLRSEKISNNDYELIKPKQNIFLNFLSLFIASFFNNWFLRGYGHDKQTFFSKFLSFVTRFFLRHLPFEIDMSRKKKLIDTLSNYLPKTQLEDLNLTLPDIFFSKEIKLFSGKDKFIKTSPHVFWDLDGYEKILLVKNKLYIHGFQHGGGYDLNKNLNLFNEKLISDYFWSWGFGDLNIIQHRYKKTKKTNSKKNKIKRIIWIERGNIPEIYKFFYSSKGFNEHIDKDVINFVETGLKNYKKIAFRVPYEKRLSDLYQNSLIKKITDNKKTPEYIIKKDDLVIFDHPRHSLIYFCLCRDISFFCVTDLKKYSKVYNNDYINFLKSKDVIIDCHGNFLKEKLKKFDF